MPLPDDDLNPGSDDSPFDQSQSQEWIAGWYDGLHAGKAQALALSRAQLRRFQLDVDRTGVVAPLLRSALHEVHVIPARDNPEGNAAYDAGFDRSAEEAFARMIETIRDSALGYGVFVADDGSATTLEVASSLIAFFREQTSLPSQAELSEGVIARFMSSLSDQELSSLPRPRRADEAPVDPEADDPLDDQGFSLAEEDDVMRAPTDSQLDREIEELEALLAGEALEGPAPEPVSQQALVAGSALEGPAPDVVSRKALRAGIVASRPAALREEPALPSKGRTTRRVAMVAFLGTLASFGGWAFFRTRDPEPTLPKKLDRAQLAGWVSPAAFASLRPNIRAVLESIDQLDFMARQANILPWLVQQAEAVMQDPSADALKTYVVLYVRKASKWEYSEALTSGLSPTMCNAQVRGSIVFAIRELWASFGVQATTPLVRLRLNAYIASNTETDAAILRELGSLPATMLSGN